MPFSMEMEVMAHDIDINCNATPSNIVKYLQEAVDHNMKNSPVTYQDLLKQNLSFLVSKTALRVYKPLKEYSKLNVETWATEGKTAAFMRNYRILQDGAVVAECLMTWALLNTETHKLLRGSDFDVSCYGTGELLTLDMPSRFRISKDAVLTKCGEKEVRYYDIDRNLHMNNVKYYDILFDRIPNCEKLYTTSVMMNYVKEAPYGKTIEIFMTEPEKSDDGDMIYCFVTKIDGETNVEARFTVRPV